MTARRTIATCSSCSKKHWADEPPTCACGDPPPPDIPIDDFIVGEIKAALDAAPDAASVNATARHYTADVERMKRSRDPYHRTMVIQIRNLVIYRLKGLKEGWG